jgi:exopolysaccharide biosynthesis polyprenyl glycosylphosphotransferase
LQVTADFAAVFVAAIAAYGLYLASGVGAQHLDPQLYLRFNSVLSLFVVFSLYSSGAYSSAMGMLRIESVRLAVLTVGAGICFLFALSFVLQLSISRLTVLLLAPALVLGLVGTRVALWRAQDKLGLLQRTAKPVIVYGAGDTGRQLARQLLEEHRIGLRPAGFVDDDRDLLGRRIKVGGGVTGEQVAVLGGQEDLEAIFEKTQANTVFIAMPSAGAKRIEELVAWFENRHISYFVVPSAGNLLFSCLQFGQIAGMPVFTRRRPILNRLYEAAKRVIDICLATLTLTLSLPIVLVSAVLIKLTSPGPVLFVQTRVGENGRPFSIYKLRTMHQDAPKYAQHPETAQDERVSAVGRWLRRLSIDELPQLWNVLRGDMSCVGPRPEMPFVVAEYNEIQRQRLTVRPGLSGLWQISEDRAFTIHDNIQHDLYYVDNRSLSLDLAILVMTPFVVLCKYGAK